MRDAFIEFWGGIHPRIKFGGGLLLFWLLVAIFYGRKPID